MEVFIIELRKRHITQEMKGNDKFSVVITLQFIRLVPLREYADQLL
jgi:hypothetical protein